MCDTVFDPGRGVSVLHVQWRAGIPAFRGAHLRETVESDRAGREGGFGVTFMKTLTLLILNLMLGICLTGCGPWNAETLPANTVQSDGLTVSVEIDHDRL